MIEGRRVLGLEIRRRHILAALVLAVGLATTLAGTILPDMGLRWGVIKALRSLGMVEVSVSDADLSLFQGNVVVRKMVARPALGAALGVKDFALRFRWAPLLSKRVVIDRVALEGVEIHVSRRPDGAGFIIDGLPLAVAAQAPAEAASDSVPWGFDVASLELTDSTLRLTDGAVVTDIAIARLVVENLDSRNPSQPVRVRLLGSLNGAALSLGGTVLPFAREPGFALEIGLDRLDLAGVAALAAKAGLDGLGGTADLSVSVNGSLGEGGLGLEASGRLGLAALRLSAPVHVAAAKLDLALRQARWAEGRLSLAGAGLTAAALAIQAPPAAASAEVLKLDLARLDWTGTRLDLAGKLDATGLAGGDGDGTGAAAALSLDAASLGWDGALAWQGGLGLTGARINAAGLEVVPQSVNWTGRLELSPAGDKTHGRAEGKLELGALSVKGFDHVAGHKHAAAEGWLEFGKPGRLPVTARLGLRAEGLGLRQPGKALDWLALDRIEAAETTISAAGVVAVERINAAGLSALRRDGKSGYPWRFEAKTLRLDRPALTAKGDLEAAELRLDGVTARVTRVKDGFLGLPPDSSPGKPTAAESRPPGLALGRLSVSGNSRVQFEDRTLAQAVRLEARPVELSLTDLDSARPNRDSGFDLKAGMGEATIVLGGVARPFADSLGGRLDGRIQALELPPLSPYLAEALGVNLRTGQFSGSFKGGAAKGALDGRLEVELANLFLAPPDPNAPMAKKIDLPVETVLDLLRDGDDRIRLTLPVRGDLANPDLDVSDAVAQAVAGALKSTMLTTLKLAFPVAALISLAVDAGDSSRLALAPLAFPPGVPALTDAHRKTLGELAQLLKGRPGVRLTLCGKADSSDWPVLAERRRAEEKPLLSRLERLVGVERAPAELGEPDRDALGDLAESRAGAAKQYLVESAGIDAGRVFVCRAEVDAIPARGPRVELLF